MFRQCQPMEQFHGQQRRRRSVASSFVLREVVYAADIRVRDAAGKLHFLLEKREQITSRGGPLADGLQSYALAELQVFGFVHFAHAALRDEANDLKTACEQRSEEHTSE